MVDSAREAFVINFSMMDECPEFPGKDSAPVKKVIRQVKIKSKYELSISLQQLRTIQYDYVLFLRYYVHICVDLVKCCVLTLVEIWCYRNDG